MKTVKCASCGAPFEEHPGEDAVRCAFCGAINERTMLRRPAPEPEPEPNIELPQFRPIPIVIDARPVRQAAKTAGCTALMGILIVTIGVGVAGYSVFRGAQGAGFRGAIPSFPQLPFGIGKPLALADLPQLRQAGRQPLEVAAPRGGYASLDPVTQLPWAQGIAQAWSKDVRLDRIDATRIQPNGTVDAAADADAEVLYRFVSPACIAHFWKLAERQSNLQAACEFWVIAKGGQTSVQLITGRPSDENVPPSPKVLSLQATLERSRARRPSRPFYNGYMIHLGREGWVWYLSSLTGRENIPRVRARDGRAWPY
jgi:LSD1 subclass zinc finger protein